MPDDNSSANPRPVMGIGSCLAGNAVRYNGETKRPNQHVKAISESFEMRAFCPEMGVGMGVPRPPIHLVGSGDEVRALEQQSELEEGIAIEPVTARDLPDVMPFIVEQFGWDWYRHARDHLLAYFSGADREHICWLVARRQGQVVGFCQQRGERFGPFGVHPAYRRRGIGRLLLVHQGQAAGGHGGRGEAGPL